MAITRCGDWGIRPDRRFGKAWGKLTGATAVDLSKENGYSLSGEWVRWDDAVVVGDGEYLVIGAVTGSVKNHKYHYRLVAGGDEVRLIGGDEINLVVESGVRAGKVTEEQLAKSQNSTLYRYALYICLVEQIADSIMEGCNAVIPDGSSLAVPLRKTHDELIAERNRLSRRLAEIDALLGEVIGEVSP